jgi:glycosyltransferase involved in cell wall biosynthesis
VSFRVIHVASGREWRGGQRQVWYLAEALAARKVDQLVVTGGGTRLERELRDSSCPVSGVTWSSALDPRALLGLMRAIRTPHPSPTILHAHDPHALILAALAAGWHRLPLVVTRRVDFPLRRTLPWRRADRVVAISQAVKGILEQSGIPSERIVVVPSGIPLNHAPPAAMDLRSALGLPPNARLAVSVGALVAHKDYPTLVRAAARLRELRPALHWVVAGEGRERSQLELLSRDLGVERAVHFIGQVDDGRSVIASGDVFVATSSEEGLNTSVLDALALGIPVVSTRAGGLPEAVGEAGVLCSGGDAKAVAHAVLALLDDPARHATFARAGPRQAAQFSSDRMAEGMLTVYHSVAPFT